MSNAKLPRSWPESRRGMTHLTLAAASFLLVAGCGPKVSRDDLGTVVFDARELPAAGKPYDRPEMHAAGEPSDGQSSPSAEDQPAAVETP